LRAAAALTWQARLQPTSPGWLDMALGVPLMDTTRAAEELGWRAGHTSEETLMELLDGLRRSGGYQTPPLASNAGGRMRVREFVTGIGSRTG
jgi:hypothetical protein